MVQERKLRLAFTLADDKLWMGGIKYFSTLFSALSELPGRPVEVFLFTGHNVPESVLDELRPYVSGPPVRSDLWTAGRMARRWRGVCAMLLQKDYSVERVFRDFKIDLVFQQGVHYGWRFRIPAPVL